MRVHECILVIMLLYLESRVAIEVKDPKIDVVAC